MIKLMFISEFSMKFVISASLLQNLVHEMKMRWMYSVTGVILQLASGTKNLGPPIKDVNLVTGYQEIDKPCKHQLNYMQPKTKTEV